MNGPAPSRTPLGPTPSGELVAGMGRNVVWSYVYYAATAGGLLFLTGFALRRLGPADFGIYAILASTAALVLILDGAMTLPVVRAAAQQAAAADSSLGHLEQIRAAHWLYRATGLGIAVFGLLLAAAVLQVGGRSDVAVAVLFLAWSTAVTLGLAAAQGVATGRRMYFAIAMAGVAAMTVQVVGAVLLIEPLGLAGLALAQLLGAITGRALLLAALRRSELGSPLRWTVSRPPAIAGVVRGATPILLLLGSAQLVATTNLYLIGLLAGAGAAGIFRAASLVPAQISQALYRGQDVVFPRLAAADRDQLSQEVNGTLTRLVGLAAGVCFGIVVSLREQVVTALLGRADATGELVLVILCGLWAANVPAHGLVLLLIARGRQSRLLPLVAVESTLNIAGTGLLTWRFGAVGAAVGATAAVVVSNAFLLPALCARLFGRYAWRATFVDGYLRLAVGAACALAVRAAYDTTSGSLAAAAGAAVAAAGVTVLAVGRAGRRLVMNAIAREH